MGLSKIEKIEYLKENYSKKSKIEILSDLGHTWSYIQKICCLNNIKRDFIESKNFNKYSELLNLDNLVTCYWIGFLLADGHIYNQMNIQINLSIKDKDHISKLKDHIGDFIINEYENHIRICLSNKNIAKYLSDQFKWKSNKTTNPPILPKLRDNQLFSLIIGFIDGDGSIDKKSIRVKCHTSWQSILEDFHYFLTGNKKTFKITTCGCSIFYINRSEILFQIKERAEKLKLPIMERKWNILERRIMKSEKYEIVNNLFTSGLDDKSIKIQTGFSRSLIYKVKRDKKI